MTTRILAILKAKEFYIGVLVPVLVAAIGLVPWLLDGPKPANISVEDFALVGEGRPYNDYSQSGQWGLGGLTADEYRLCHEDKNVNLTGQDAEILEGETPPVLSFTIRNTGEQLGTLHGVFGDVYGPNNVSSGIFVSRISANAPMHLRDLTETYAEFAQVVAIATNTALTIEIPIVVRPSQYSKTRVCFELDMRIFNGEEMVSSPLGKFEIYRIP